LKLKNKKKMKEKTIKLTTEDMFSSIYGANPNYLIMGTNIEYPLIEYRNLLNLRWGGNGLFIKILEKKSNTPFYCIVEFSEDDVKLSEKDAIKTASGEEFKLNDDIIFKIIDQYLLDEHKTYIEFFKYENKKIVQIEDMAGKADSISMDLNDPIEFIFDHFDSNGANETIIPRMKIVEISPEEFYQLESE